MKRDNLIIKRLADGHAAIGVASQMNSPENVEIAGAAGFDFTYIDCEHGSFYIEGATNMIRAAEAVGITPIVRLPNHDASAISRILDAGAMGVIIPNVTTREQVAAIVTAAKYKCDGNGGARGACPGTRATWHQTTEWPEFVEWANKNTLVWPLIESPEGVANIEAIASVPGVHALMLGPFDYAHAVGLPGQSQHPEVQKAFARVIQAAKYNGIEVVASLFSPTPEKMEEEKKSWLAMGARILVAGSDRRMLHNSMSQRVKVLR